MIFDTSAPAHTKYGESKYVAERILDKANIKIPRLSTSVLRTGQIAGPINPNSFWPKREWLPSLISSSKAIGALPKDLGRMDEIDWVPTDIFADCILELVSNNNVESKSSDDVYCVLHPHARSCQDMLPTIHQKTEISKSVDLCI